MLLFKEFSFDSAHFLPLVHDGHKCKNMHGHTYLLKVWIKGLPNELGWIMDFADVKDVIDPIIKKIDHKCLNDIEGLANPTCEMIAIWIWNNIKLHLPQLYKIELYETPTSGVEYYGN